MAREITEGQVNPSVVKTPGQSSPLTQEPSSVPLDLPRIVTMRPSYC